MKRFFLPSLLLLAMGRPALCYENNQVVQVPPMDQRLVVIDDTNFINNSLFAVDMTTLQNIFGGTAIFTTSSTQNYTNTGVLNGIPGFDFENFPASVGQAHMAANFVNIGNGLGGGDINITNIYGGLNPFFSGLNPILTGINQGLVLGVLIGPVNFELPGLSTLKVRATNIVNSGLVNMESTGLIDLLGQDVNLNRSRFLMSGGGGINVLDFGGGGFATNSSGWDPQTDLQPTFALSPIYTNFQGLPEQMLLGNATPYFENLAPQTNANGVIVWRIIYLEDSSPTNVSASVFFGNAGLDAGAFHIQWTGTFRDPFTGGNQTNYFVLSDVPDNRRGPFFFTFPNQIPADFSFAESTLPIITGTPAAPGYVPAPFSVAGVSNDFTYISVQPTPMSVGTNQIIGGSPTNLPGRMQFTSLGSLDLNNAHIAGGNYLSLNAPVNYLGNSNSIIVSPFTDLNLGVTNGSLIVSNLLVPELPQWTGASGALSSVFIFGSPMGGIQAFSGSYFFVDANGITNDVRVLMVNSALQPSFPALEKDVAFHAPKSLVISDELNIYNKFSSDTASLTVATNANSAYSLQGFLSLMSPDILWSSSLPNLQYLTNWGQINTTNLANFADGMPNPFSPRSTATPYQAFVNHGTITDEGAFIFANYFENSGVIQEYQIGNMDISATTATITNGLLSTTNGAISIAAGDLFISNNVITAGRSLTLTPSCSFSDGYVFSNMFGHATNTTPVSIVTNGNFWTASGVRVNSKPATADLLGTTITNFALNSLNSANQWAGEDRGAKPSGFADNLALGRMIFVSDANPSQFTFVPVMGNNALYVDTIEFDGGATNTDNAGNYTAFNIQPGMKIYYAQALAGGASIAEKLNGKNGGGFLWVSNYAGVYSSTNLTYQDGNTYIFNEALVISPDIDSDGDGTVNINDATPIPVGSTTDTDITVFGPQPCNGGQPPGTNPPPIIGTNGFGSDTLPFPPHHVASSNNAVSFALAVGSYNGLFYETNVSPASSGFFTAKVTSKGTFSARLQLGAKTYSFSGAFNSSGNNTMTVMGKNLPALTVTLHLVNNDQIIGQVAGNGWTAQLLAVNKSAATGAGKHSLVLSSDKQSPSGDSFGTMTLSKTGDVQWSGVLPDGTKITQKSALSKDGIWPLYSSLYGGSGSLVGWMQLTNGNTDIGGSAVWIAPANPNGLYPNGLTNQLNATGSSLTTPPNLTHSTVILSGSQFSSPLTNNVIISGKTGRSDDRSLTLSVDIKNGLFNGSVTDPDSGQKLSFQGALLEKSGIGGGFFLNANKDQGGKVYLAPAN